MKRKPRSSACVSSVREYFRNKSCSPALAAWPSEAMVGEMAEPMASPICASSALLIWFAEWCATTCPVSWPSTAASSASLFTYASKPRLTKTGPPGSAKALTLESSTISYEKGKSAPVCAAICLPRSATYGSSLASW